jgi:hypothetical protein
MVLDSFWDSWKNISTSNLCQVNKVLREIVCEMMKQRCRFGLSFIVPPSLIRLKCLTNVNKNITNRGGLTLAGGTNANSAHKVAKM